MATDARSELQRERDLYHEALRLIHERTRTLPPSTAKSCIRSIVYSCLGREVKRTLLRNERKWRKP